MEITPKACGDKTDGKKTFNHTAGKVWGYRENLLVMNPVYVQGYTYIIFILICMYMNFHTFRMKIHIRAGVFFISADAS